MEPRHSHVVCTHPPSLEPRRGGGGESAWYLLFVHALNFPTFCKTESFPWLVDVRYVFVTVSRLYSVNNDLDQAVSYLQRLGCAAMTLKPEQRASLK